MKSYKFIITGRVQGVFYRKTIASNALKFNGYVKNLPNGDVEACITCKEVDKEQFIPILKQGSSNSIVDNITQTLIDEVFNNGFKIIY